MSEICPRHGRQLEPCVNIRPDKEKGYIRQYIMGCSACTFENMFYGTEPAATERPLTREEFEQLADRGLIARYPVD